MPEIESIKKIVEDNPQFYAVKVKANPALRKFLFAETKWLDEIDPLLKTRIYCVLNGIKAWPRCLTCDKEIKTNVQKLQDGFPKYCSSGCVSKNADIKRRKENTMLEHYGVKNPSECASIQAKKIQTSITRYGTHNPTQAPMIKEKIRRTNIDRRGVPCALQASDVKAKAIKSLRERYGVDNAFASKEVQERIRETNRERYGCDYGLQNSEVKAKISETNRHKYGVEYIFQSEEMREKSKRTSIKSYGVEYPCQSQEVIDRIRATNMAQYGVTNQMQRPEVRNKARNTMMERYGVDNPLRSEEIKEKVRQTCLARYGAENPFTVESIKDKIKATNIARYGVENPSQCKEIQDKLHPTYNYHGIIFQSGPELAFYIWLVDHNIEFEYHPASKVMSYVDSKGKSHRYFPDFWLVKSDEIIEIKGINHFENHDPNGKMICINDRSKDYVAEAKHQCMLRNGVRIMTNADYCRFERYVREKYGSDYLKRFKRK